MPSCAYPAGEMQILLSPLRQIGKPSLSTDSISPVESKSKVIVELMLPQLVPFPTVPAVIVTSLVRKLREVLVAPFTIPSTTILSWLEVNFILTVSLPRALCCEDRASETRLSLAVRSSKDPFSANRMPTAEIKTVIKAITATNSTNVNPAVSGI